MHHEHIVHHFVYIFSISYFLLEVSVNYRFNDFDIKYLSLIYSRHQSTNISIHIESLKEANRKWIRMLNILLAFFISVLMILTSNIWQWRIKSSNCKYHCSCLETRSRISFRDLYFYFFFVFVLIIDEHRMHARRSTEESALLSYKRTRYLCISHTLIILSLQFKSELPSHIGLQKPSSPSSPSSPSPSSSPKSSWLSRPLWTQHIHEQVIDITYLADRWERRRSNELIASGRSWEKTKDNVTSVHRIQHLAGLTSTNTVILSHRIGGSGVR